MSTLSLKIAGFKKQQQQKRHIADFFLKNLRYIFLKI